MSQNSFFLKDSISLKISSCLLRLLQQISKSQGKVSLLLESKPIRLYSKVCIFFVSTKIHIQTNESRLIIQARMYMYIFISLLYHKAINWSKNSLTFLEKLYTFFDRCYENIVMLFLLLRFNLWLLKFWQILQSRW